METMLQLLGIIGRLTVSSEEVYAAMLGCNGPAVTGYASDARTAILARFRYLGLDMEMDKMYAQFRERSKQIGLPSHVTYWITEDGKAAI